MKSKYLLPLVIVAFTGLQFPAKADCLDLGYGPCLFYYLSHDDTGFSTLGTISTSGAVTDRFGVGFRFDALTFAEATNP